jgi:hypothetical protein
LYPFSLQQAPLVSKGTTQRMLDPVAPKTKATVEGSTHR